jgi:mono/diheme cytochrome c family protein
MPAREYAVMTDSDVDDLIAFLRRLPPVDRTIARGAAPLPVAPAIAASAPPSDASSAALTGGPYIATIAGCTNCHGANLAGTIRPAGPAAPNISHDGIGTWTFGDFQTAMRPAKHRRVVNSP